MPTTLASQGTPLNADVVAFCPYEGHEHLLACGCYELTPDADPSTVSGGRIGRLALLSTAADALVETHAIEGTGVLDCAWLPPRPGGPHVLALATAAGTAHLYSLRGADAAAAAGCADGNGRGSELVDAGSMACENAGVCMSLAWSDTPFTRLALSSTAGKVYVGALAEGGLRQLTAWQAHELEGWAVAFGWHDEHTLYSGADDGLFKRWDLRTAIDDDGGCGAPLATATNRKSHRAGVRLAIDWPLITTHRKSDRAVASCKPSRAVLSASPHAARRASQLALISALISALNSARTWTSAVSSACCCCTASRPVPIAGIC